MSDQNILQWKLFRESSNSPVDLKEYSAVHFFDNGESAYLIKDGQLYGCTLRPLVNSMFGSSQPLASAVNPFGVRDSFNLIKFDDFGFNGIKAIATGASHTVLLDSDGHVFCWGSNLSGQIGVGHCSNVNTQWKTNLEDIDQIACGKTFTIALSKCDELWFWGKLCLDGSNVLFHNTPTLIDINGDPVPKYISAGDQHFSVLTKNSKVYVMGNNEVGQLALGHRNVLKHPEPVPLQFKAVHAQCAFERIIVLHEANGLYICDRTTNNELQLISDAQLIVSFATHWRTDFFVAVDACGFFHKPLITDEKISLIRTAYHDISDGFIDIGTPSVFWPNQKVGPKKTSFGLTKLSCNKAVFKCASHIDVSSLFNSQVCSDVSIKLSDGVIHAHRLVLTARSTYLEKMLTETHWKEKVVDMTNMNAAVYKAFVSFLYTGRIQLDSVVDVPELYCLAEKDKNKKLIEQCILLWENGLRKENIVKAYEKAFQLNSKVLIDHCDSTLNLHLQYILNSEEYNSLDVPVKLALLTSAATHHTIKKSSFIAEDVACYSFSNKINSKPDRPSTSNFVLKKK